VIVWVTTTVTNGPWRVTTGSTQVGWMNPTQPSVRRPIARWPLSITITLLIALATLAIVLVSQSSEAGLRLAIRSTARSSFVLFALAFSASTLERFIPSAFTHWQRRSRRQLGLAFAGSHAVHALAIAGLAGLYPAAFAEHTRHTNIVPGLVAYAFIVVMAASSSDRIAAWLGARAWKVLHTVGGLYIWVSFAKAFYVRTPGQPLYWLPVSVLALLMLLRVLGWIRAERPGDGRALLRRFG
jgi:methionine sulfoxide reductase heme-binding subunit